MGFSIREAILDDAAPISELINLCVVNKWTTLCPVTVEEEVKYIEELGDREVVFVATVDDVFAGFASISQVNPWSDRYNHCATGGTWVYPRFWGMGVSKKLWFEGVFPFGDSVGFLHYSHTVPVSNIRAVRHYEGIGFNICGYLRGYIRWENDVFEDALLMEFRNRG